MLKIVILLFVFISIDQSLASSVPENGSACANILQLAYETDLKEFAIKTYGRPFGLSALKKLRALNPAFEVFIADIPTMSRLDAFIQFVKDNKLEALTPQELKDRFRISLGVRRVYRALALSDVELSNIGERGLDSNFLRFTNEPDRRSGIQQAISTGLLDILRDRFAFPRTKMSQDIYLSTSDFAEVAAGAVAVTIDTSGKNVFIFQLDLSVADLFSIGPSPFNFPPNLQTYVDNGLEAKIVQPDGTTHIYKFDASVERFAVLRIGLQNVSAIYKVKENSLPVYHSVVGEEPRPDLDQSYLSRHTVQVH